MIKEIDDFYSCLGKLEEAYQTESSNSQNSLAINEARLKLESAISKVEILLTELISLKEVLGARI
ncbi:hypothetical protein [Anaeroselena agilis]|uniref:Uncharacterized protein n=1 Tax=Anaeroselena agilis TaxID=3063788 RepID=A0ABU3NVX2_9FIRM|nr:hypothetical protein [Selenomonadales bacterium 4137-cl]